MPLKTSALYWNPSKKSIRKSCKYTKATGIKKPDRKKNDNLEQLTVKDRQKNKAAGNTHFLFNVLFAFFALNRPTLGVPSYTFG